MGVLRWAWLSGAFLCLGCGTVDLGSNIIPPDLNLDEDFFYCQIMPNCIETYHCAGGGAGQEGQCHSRQSSMRLIDTVMLGTIPPMCDMDNQTTSEVPAEYRANFEAVGFAVQSDPNSSPIFRRPTGMDSHPVVLFQPSDEGCPQLLQEWITRGGL